MSSFAKRLASLLVATAATAAGATSSIDTTATWNNTRNVGPFGEPDTATFGQSITTDADGGLLQSFTFYLSALDLDVRAFVVEWDGSKAVGSALFVGSAMNIGDAFAGFKAVQVQTNGLRLQGDKQYVLGLTSSGLQVSNFNTNTWGTLNRDQYAGGEFVFHNSGNDFQSLWADAGWDCGDGCGFNGNGADLVFKAVIDAAPPLLVPEPDQYALLLSGLGFLAWRARRRA